MDSFKHLKQYNLFWISLSILLGILITWPHFGPYYLNPNEYMFAFGGDALILYYNVAYHTMYGVSHTLTNMCYPEGELIYMTDAQGALSMSLQKINHFIPIGNYVVGFINGINVYSYLISVVLYYFLFIELSIKKERAWLFAPFIAIMSPQIIRIISHHGLGNMAILPLCFLWFIRKYKLQNVEKRDGLVFILLLFFAFNNPYLGFMITTFLFLSFTLWMIINRKFDNKIFFFSFISILPLILLFSYFEIFNPYDDRLKLQWGYFVFRSNFEGLFLSPNGLLGSSIKTIFNKEFSIMSEADMNVYLVLTLALVANLFHYLRNRKKGYQIIFSLPVKISLTASFLLFLYSSGIIFLPFSKEKIEDSLGMLLMFKAVARLSWPFWMMLSISGLILVDNLLSKIDYPAYKVFLPSIIFLFLLESNFVLNKIFDNTQHANFFSKSKMGELEEELKKSNINFENYQAMLLLPKMMAWHDNFYSDVSFNAQFNGIRISLLKKLPLISGMFSRISSAQIAERIEFLSHPLIEKSLQTKFPDKRQILILADKHTPLKTGELSLVNRASLLFENDTYKLLAFDPFKINDNEELNLAQSLNLPDSISNSVFFHEGFDKEINASSYFGKGSKTFDHGIHEIVTFPLVNETDSIYTFSGWSKIDYEKYGVGFWELVIKDKDGKEKERLNYEIRKSNDIHDNWIRAEMSFKMKAGDSVGVILHADRPLTVDEIHIKPNSKHTVIEGGSAYRLFDGIKVKKKI